MESYSTMLCLTKTIGNVKTRSDTDKSVPDRDGLHELIGNMENC